MKNFSLRTDDDLDKMLELYMKKNKLKSKNQTINNMIDYFVRNSDAIASYNELNKKIERVVKLASLNNNLIEQLFSNHHFPMNYDKNEDEILKETYDNIKNKFFIFMD